MSSNTGSAASGFLCSDRNLGGRKIIYDQLYNHMKNLSTIKSSIGDTLKPPKAHVD